MIHFATIATCLGLGLAMGSILLLIRARRDARMPPELELGTEEETRRSAWEALARDPEITIVRRPGPEEAGR